MTTLRTPFSRVAVLAFVVSLAHIYVQAHDSAKPFPRDIDAFSLEITEKGLNKLNMLPMGAHTDDSTRFIFSGHQKGGNVSALLLGIPGIAVSSKINSIRGKDRLSEIEITEASLVEELALSAIASAFNQSEVNPIVNSPSNAKHSLQVSPYAAIVRSKKDGTKLHAMLAVNLVADDNPDRSVWKSQFYGEFEGLLDEAVLSDPAQLYENLEKAFQRSAWGLARIVNDDFTTYEPVMAEGWLAWFRKTGKLPCILLQRDEDNTLLRLPFGAIIAGSGYNVMSTSSLSTQPFKKVKDKYKTDFYR